jgi:hypothetical protein
VPRVKLGPRVGLSSVLIAGSIVLLISIIVGNSMGNRVLSQVSRQEEDFAPSPVASPSDSPDSSGPANLQWKRRQIVSVATDPGFPDPRVPPPPVYVPTPRLTPRPTPKPKPSARVEDGTDSHYTSPPLPIPIVSHGPDDQSDPYGEPLPSSTPSAEVTEVPRPGASPSGAPGHEAMATP